MEYCAPNAGYGEITDEGTIEGYYTGSRDRADKSYDFVEALRSEAGR